MSRVWSALSSTKVVWRVLLNLLVAFVAIAGAVLLVRSLLVPVVETVFHLGEPAVSFVRRVGIFLGVLAAYLACARFYERRVANEVRFAPLGIVLGAASGAALISITTVSLFAIGAYECLAWRGVDHALSGVAGVIAVAAFLEEVVYRGVLFRVLEQAWGTPVALGLQALIFGAMHLANVDASPLASVTTLVSVTLLGALWTAIYIYSRNLWVVSAHHAAWNFAILLTGVPLSGLDDWRAVAPLETRYAGPDWLTGGAFGPENSILSIGVMAVALAVAVVLCQRDGRFVGWARVG